MATSKNMHELTERLEGGLVKVEKAQSDMGKTQKDMLDRLVDLEKD